MRDFFIALFFDSFIIRILKNYFFRIIALGYIVIAYNFLIYFVTLIYFQSKKHSLLSPNIKINDVLY